MKIAIKDEYCDICCDSKINWSYCPYFEDHKWCDDCNMEIDKCPYCRRDFKKILIIPYTIDMEVNPLYVNRPLVI